jgi:hypothetical protein
MIPQEIPYFVNAYLHMNSTNVHAKALEEAMGSFVY